MKNALIMSFFVLVLTIWSIDGIASGVVTVYFIPFEIDTLLPVTPKSIDACEASEKWTITGRAEAQRLLNILSQGKKAHFDNERVRVKISDIKNIYYIDQDGVVLAGKSSYRIDSTKLEQFRASLRTDQLQMIRKRFPCP